jgi:hypothetical protein
MAKRIAHMLNRLIDDSKGSGFLAHIYIDHNQQTNENKNPFGNTNFFEFNLLSRSSEWIMKGSAGHGQYWKKQPTTIPILNFFHVDEIFKKSFLEMIKQGKGPTKFKGFVVVTKRGLRQWLGVQEVFEVKATGIPAASEEEAVSRDIPNLRWALAPFNFCNVVRVRTPKNELVGGPYLPIPGKYIRAIGSSYHSEPTLISLCEKKKIKAYCIAY